MPSSLLARSSVLLPLAYMGLIHWLSSIPGDVPPDLGPITAVLIWTPPAVQNLLHVPLFGGLAWLWRWSLQAWLPSRRSILLVAFLFTVVYGLADEWHQTAVPGRYGSLTDVLLNTLGAFAALWMYEWRSARRIRSDARREGGRTIA